jgi:transposase, IS30 family
MARHLTLAERQVLHRMVKAKKSRLEISERMKRHGSTIWRELKRNSNAWGYRPETAQRLARQRRVVCRRPYKLKDIDLRLYVSDRLRKAWSPDQIAGRLRREFPHEPARWVSAAGDLRVDQALCAASKAPAATGTSARATAEN